MSQPANQRSGDAAHPPRFEAEPDRIREGVPSWTDVERPLPRIDTETLRDLTDALADRPLRDALGDVVSVNERSVRNALFVDPADAWRIPVSRHLTGRCLDVNTGVGTRALLIAELATSVDAAGTCPAALRFLAERDDYACGDRVTPIHADLDRIPMPRDPYDTVIADLSGHNRPDSFADAVDSLTEYVADDGSLLLLLDGPPRIAGATNAFDLGTSTDGSSEPVAAVRQTCRGSPVRIGQTSFSTIERYALVPDPEETSFVFPADHGPSVDRLIDVDGASRLLTWTAGLADRAGVLARCWPAYLVAYSMTEPGESTAESLDSPIPKGFLTRGGSRSTVFDEDDFGIEGVVKVPHRRAHSEFILDERRTMRDLRSGATNATDDAVVSIAETIPDGSVTMTRFGPTYIEDPAPGTPLSTFIEPTPERFRRVLEIGFDWIVRRQRIHAGPVARRSPAVVRDELSFPELDLDPPSIQDPVRLFRAPCHGDLHPKNVFVEAEGSTPGPITAVIDWELSGLDDNPIADPAFFAIQTARLTFGGLEPGIEAAFASPSPYADAVRDCIGDYCSAMGIDRSAFLTYLPVVWTRRLRRCAARDATASYSGRAVRRADDVRLIWDRRSSIEAVIGDGEDSG